MIPWRGRNVQRSALEIERRIMAKSKPRPALSRLRSFARNLSAP
jgi:hypothetical protein